MATKKKSFPQATSHSQLEVPPPPTRSLQVYAIDPSSGKYSGNQVTVRVPWERLEPGPTGRKIAVVDYDAANKCYYPPINLEDPRLLANDGLDPTEADPRFHQQMVYAIASRTIQMFEVALGRDIHWRRADRIGGSADKENKFRKADDIWILKLYPHAMQQANAYYSPQAHGILFGYFTAKKTGQGRNLPGQLVFTCLSQDIVSHEVTHAVIDGIRTYFTEPTNPDVLAFHEGFADLCALFSHFSQHDSLIDTIRQTGGRLYQSELNPVAGDPANTDQAELTAEIRQLIDTIRKTSAVTNKAEPDSVAREAANADDDDNKDQPAITAEIRRTNPLIQLAIQFGQASGKKRGLRSALGTPPNSDDIHNNVNDPHFRGSILVAAVFDAFFSIYMKRADTLFRIYHAGGIDAVNAELPAPLAELLATCATQTAVQFFQLCARSIDYCPPIDITFGDFLRALITVSRDIDPSDDDGVRDALMEAFRLRGIYSESASFYSEDALSWPPVADLPAIDGLVFGSPNGLTSKEKDQNGDALRSWANKHRAELGLDPDLPLTVPSFHPVFRTQQNGRLRMEMVVEIIQSTQAQFSDAVPQAGTFPFRAGVTLIVEAPKPKSHEQPEDVPPKVRFVIGREMTGPDAKQREEKQRSFFISQGLAVGNNEDATHFQANFGLLHEEY
jgi:hypothetical protein